MNNNELKIGDRVYCDNFGSCGKIVRLSSDSVGLVVDYKEEEGGAMHRVYAYMLTKI